MKRKRLFTLVAVAVVAIAALVIALASGGTGNAGQAGQSGPGPYAGSAAKQSPAGAGAAIDVRGTPLGKILVDANGRTIYLSEADKQNMSNCSGACLSLWPAFTSGGKPQARGGAIARKIGTIRTGDGNRQVTYNGHPLYYYAGDQKPGDTSGQGLDQFGAEWYVLAVTGDEIGDD